MSLQTELGMQHGFRNRPHEAMLSVYYTAARLRKRAGELFRHFNLTDVQYNVLSLLVYEGGEKGGLTQVELSRMMLVNRANITTLIDRMEKAGLVIRKSIPNDRRYNIIQITQHGEDKYHEVAGTYGKVVAELMSCLNEDELTSVISLLQKVRENLDIVAESAESKDSANAV